MLGLLIRLGMYFLLPEEEKRALQRKRKDQATDADATAPAAESAPQSSGSSDVK